MPVLSVQSMSTRARVSMPNSSCTSVFLRPSFTTPAISATEVSRIRPSGIMPIMAATALGTESRTGDFSKNTCSKNSRIPMGTSSLLTRETSLFSSVINSDLGDRMRLASFVSRAA